MPIKKRLSKHKPHVAPEAWEMMFQSGHDFLGDLDALGLPNRLHTIPGSDESEAVEAAWRVATEAAWRQHGATYLETHEATQGVSQRPWALDTFGPPEGYTNAS